MAVRRTVLEVDITSDSTDAIREFDDVADAADRMGTAVDRASTVSSSAGGGLDSAADSADNLASKSSQATGGLGALAAGFELVGAEKYAIGLQSAAMATDFFSGVGDIGNLVLQSTAIQTAKNTVLKAKDVVVTGAQTVATKTLTIAQKALNLAMRANPIGLAVTAGLALAALFVTLYKRNETFRNGVNKAFSFIKGVFSASVGPLVDLARWIGDRIPGAASRMKDLVVGYFKLITLPQRTVINLARDLIGWFADRIPGAAEAMKKAVVGFVQDMITPFETLLDWVNDVKDAIGDLISSIADIDLPDIDIPGLGLLASGTDPGGRGVQVAQVTVQGAVDPYGTARTIRDVLSAEQFAVGRVQFGVGSVAP